MSTTIQAKINDWRKQLLDLSKRNRLINCKIGTKAGLEIEYPTPDTIWQKLVLDNSLMTFVWKSELLQEPLEDDLLPGLLPPDEGKLDDTSSPKTEQSDFELCLASGELLEEHLLTQLNDRTLATRLNRLSLNAKTSLAEQGVNILYLAFGLLRWFESNDSDVALLSPLLLVPVALNRDGPDSKWELSVSDEEAICNQCLREMLATNFNLKLPEISEEGLENPSDRDGYLQQVREAIKKHQRWEVLDKVILNTFSFQKIAMWEDLGQNAVHINSHDICRAIGGDDTSTIVCASDLPSGYELDDKVLPKTLHTILDCDSSQLEAIIAVKNGVSLVLDGPPGTGKSQTIANIIAECLADKKRVLFVSEKAAALEVVKTRLDQQKLGDFCLECHSHKANKKDVITELGRCLHLSVEHYRDQSTDLGRLHDVRSKLNAYVRSLHKPKGALNYSPYIVHGKLAHIKVNNISRCNIHDVLSIDGTQLKEIVESLKLLMQYQTVLNDYEHHPWRGCKINSFSLTVQDDIRHDFGLIASTIEILREPLSILSDLGLVENCPTKIQLEVALDRIARLRQYPVLPSEWFTQSPRKIATSYLTLDSQFHEYRDRVRSLPGFKREHLDGSAEQCLNAVINSSNMWIWCLQTEDTVRIRHQLLLKLIDTVSSLRYKVEKIGMAVEKFVVALQMPLAGNTSLNLLSKLIALGKIIGKTGPFNSSWFSDEIRGELKKISLNVHAKQSAAEIIRNRLSVRLKDQAFSTIPDSLIEDCRELSRYRKQVRNRDHAFREHIKSLFNGPIPKSWKRLSDNLNTFLRIEQHLLEIRKTKLARLSPLAFDTDGAKLANDAIGFYSFWSRLFGKWRIFKNKATSSYVKPFIDMAHACMAWVFRYKASTLYVETPPKDFKTLLDDMEFLRDYHNQAACACQELPAGMIGNFAKIDGLFLKQEMRHIHRMQKKKIEMWNTLKMCLDNLYIGDRPSSIKEIYHDLLELQNYRGHLSAVQQIETDNRDKLNTLDVGTVNWDSIDNHITAVDQIKTIIKIPDRLKQVLTTPGIIDREKLYEAAIALEQELNDLSTLDKSPDAQLIIEKAALPTRSYSDNTIDSLLKMLIASSESLNEANTIISDLIKTFRDDHDISMNRPKLSEYLLAIVGVRELREQIQANSLEIHSSNLPSLDTESQEWTVELNLARTTLEFLDHYHDAPSKEYIQVVTSPEIREKVGKATTQLQASLNNEYQQAWKTLESVFDINQNVSNGFVISTTSLQVLAGLLHEMINNLPRLQEWLHLAEVLQQLKHLNILSVFDEVLKGEIILNELDQSYVARFYRLWLDAVYKNDSSLRAFKPENHEQLIAQFRELDQNTIEGTYKRIRSNLLSDPDRPHVGMLNIPPSSEAGILLREVSKKKRHLSLRQLFKKIPSVLPRLKPCLMMSPLAVSTYLDSPEMRFDIVIFDEASQVRPFDAIGAIYRGKQLVVAGDQKQLPPTSFFDAIISDDSKDDSDEEDDDNRIADFESILDVCCSIGMPRRRLRWHYRSRRESLIAFSNHNYYGNELVTFPSAHDVDGQSAVVFHHIPNGHWRPGSSGGYNHLEAQATAALVFDYFVRHPKKSLGVITFNQRQQFAVLDELDSLRRQKPEMEEYFDEEKKEPFFVKNLENVQGDERDHIIISIGYGYDEHGKFAMRFGPLNRQGGERRLNVAITRAKYQVSLVSSIHATDIDLNRTQSNGARLLRNYLEYAERGISCLGSEITDTSDSDYDSEFEMEVEQQLRMRGLNVRHQVGCGGYRIDLALVDPNNPGRYVLGIECDGAAYHSSATARDRDRIRQNILEGLGWKICRIWSTDWIRNPEPQIDKVMKHYESSLNSIPDENDGQKFESEAKNSEPEEPIIQDRPSDNGNGIYSLCYSRIEDVPYQQLGKTIVNVLSRSGQTDRKELIRAVARDLGFSRTGNKIQARIEFCMKDLLHKREILKSASGMLFNPPK